MDFFHLTYEGESNENLKLHVTSGPLSLHNYCAVVLHSCVVLLSVGHSSNHQYHCCQLTKQSNCFDVLLTVHLSIFISVFNQIDA